MARSLLIPNIFQKGYTLLGKDNKHQQCLLFQARNLLFALTVSTVALISLALAYRLGGRSIYCPGNPAYEIINRRIIRGPLSMNESFMGRPDDRRVQMWNSLYPRYGGFFSHPTLAPELSVFSAFHQIHCLEIIWQRSWALQTVFEESLRKPGNFERAAAESHHHSLETSKTDEQGLEKLLNTAHMDHCIELLRNVLMCQPDLTVEVADEKQQVTGLEAIHECRVWDDLVDWTRKWE